MDISPYSAKLMWLGFTALFGLLAVVHVLKALRDQVPRFVMRGKIGGVSGHSTGVVEFISDFNGYIDSVNATNRATNWIACGGYVAAGLTALLSYLTTVVQS